MHLGSQWIHQNAYGRISTESSWERYCRKGGQFTTTLQFGSQIYSYASKPWKFLQQKHQWIKNWRHLKRFRRGTWRKSEVNQRWSMKQGRRAQKFILLNWWKSVIWRLPNWRQKAPTNYNRVVLRGDIVIDDSGSWAVFTEQGSFSITNDSSKNHGYHIQTARVRRTSSWRSICLYPGKMEDAPKLLKFR